ncbi:hypothetical protein ACH9EU_04255 [Kocuria sp. M1R5S2]
MSALLGVRRSRDVLPRSGAGRVDVERVRTLHAGGEESRGPVGRLA